MRTVPISSYKVLITVSLLDKDDELVFLNNIGEYKVLICSASDPPFGMCQVFVYKQSIKVGMVKNN